MTYKVVKVSFSGEVDKELEAKLNSTAKDGWELVSASTYSEAGFTQALMEASTTSGYLLIFQKSS